MSECNDVVIDYNSLSYRKQVELLSARNDLTFEETQLLEKATVEVIKFDEEKEIILLEDDFVDEFSKFIGSSLDDATLDLCFEKATTIKLKIQSYFLTYGAPDGFEMSVYSKYKIVKDLYLSIVGSSLD